jgi:hypothetical protein
MITLSDDQKIADKMMDEWIDNYYPFMCINGISGSGKSTVVANKLRQRNISNCILTAPTHESLEVLAETIPEYSARTIYSLLGYIPTATETIDQILIRAGRKNGQDPPPKEVMAKYVILDEAFYTPNLLIDSILNNYSHIKWLFMGDPAQLKSLKDQYSLLLDKSEDFKYRVNLLQDMRSVDPLQKQRMLEAREIGRSYDLSDHIISKPKAMREIVDYFESCDADPQKGGDPANFDFLALAYHHRVVNKMGEDLRELIYGYQKDLPPQPGELIRVTEVVDADGNAIVRCNERVRVIQYSHAGILIERLNNERCYLPIDCDNRIQEALVIAKQQKSAKFWAYYHQLKRSFVQIKSANSLTAHSAQGRTCKKSIVVLGDIIECESDELHYVALGRSRELAWLVDSW